jgi:hypothetical protein
MSTLVVPKRPSVRKPTLENMDSGEIVYEAFKSHPDTYDLRVGTFLS